uniref:Na+/proline symporter n=1 Tax=Candidatus Kentrum sp. FW TaxID=2126338 RepID=A0A450SPW6_9GAMM|nr:MAG: Na+/proline symporter [Candidatus Kentron sp. FW]
MNILDQQGLILLLAVFAAIMLGVTWLFGRGTGTPSVDGFILANRNVPWWLGGPSVAASWTWAIALMVSVQLAYENGFAGAFWFTAPNIAAVLIFIWLAPKLRAVLPEGYSLPEWMYHRTRSGQVVGIYLLVFAFYQVMAVTVQIYAGSHLLSAATGASVYMLMPVLLGITLAYTLISGLRASVVTDILQLAVLLLIGGATVWFVLSADGSTLSFSGVSGAGGVSTFEVSFMLTTGVITSIGLLSGAIGDQQLWQRALALRTRHVKAGFLFGALLFAVVPIGLSFIGFAGAGMGDALVFPAGVDSGLAGFVIVQQVAPMAIVIAFLLMILAGLSSTLDSGLMAWVSLTSLIRKRPWQTNRRENDHSLSVGASRLQMAFVAAIGLALAYAAELIPGFGLKYLWWFMNTMGASIAIPTLLSLTWPGLTAKGVVVGSLINLVIGLPVVAFASATGNNPLLASAYVGILLVSSVSCFVFRGRTDSIQPAAS